MGTKLPTIQQLQSLNTQTGNQTTSNNTSESSSSIYSPSTTDAEAKQENKNSNLEIIGRGLATGLGSILTGATKHIDNAIDAPSAIKNAFYSNLASKDSNKNNEIIQTKARSAADTYKQKTETSIFGQAVKNYENKIDENQQAIVSDNPNSKLAETVYKGTELAESAGGVLVDAALAAATAGIGGAITGTAGMGSAAAAKAVGATAETVAAKTAAEAAVSTAAKAASLGTMWMSVFNQSNQEALNSGYDAGQSAQKAFGDATLEVATELMFAGIAGTNKKAVDGYVSKTLNKAVTDLTDSERKTIIANAVGLRKAGLLIAEGAAAFAKYADESSWLGEALEEMTSEALSPFIERVATGNKDVEPATLSSILEAGLGGAVLSVAMGGVGRIANKAVTDIQKQSVVKQYTSTKEGRLNLVSQIIQNGELGGEAQTKAFNQLMGRDLTTPIQKQAKGVLSKLFPGKTQSNNYIKGINLNNDGTRLMTFEALDRYVNSEQTEADFQSLVGTLEEAFAADAEYSVLKRQKEIFNETDKTKFVESNETVKADTKTFNDAKALVDSLEEELKAETDEKAKAQISAELKTARANLSTAEEALAKSKANVAKTVGIAYSKADAVETFGQESVDRFKASQRFAIEDRGYLYTVDESGVFKPVRYNDYVEANTDAVAQTLYKKSYDQLTKEEKSAVNDQVTKNFNTELKALKNKHSAELKQFVGELNDQISKSPIGGNLKVETKSLKGKGRMAESQGDVIRFDPSKVYTVTAAKYYLSHELLHYTVANVLGNEAKTNFYDNLKSLATSMGWSYDGFYRKMMNSRNYNATWDEQIVDKENSSGKKFSEEEKTAYKEKMAEEETLARFISTALDYKQILSAMQVESPDVLNQLEQGLLKTGVKNMINTQWDYARLKALKNIEEAKATPMAAEDIKEDVAKAMQSLEEDINEYYTTDQDGTVNVRPATRQRGEDLDGSLQGVFGVFKGIQPSAIPARDRTNPKTNFAKGLVERLDNLGIKHAVVPSDFFSNGGETIAAAYGDLILIVDTCEGTNEATDSTIYHEKIHVAKNSGNTQYLTMLSDFVLNRDYYFKSEESMDRSYKYYLWYVEGHDPKNWNSYTKLDLNKVSDERLMYAADEMLAQITGRSYLPYNDGKVFTNFNTALNDYNWLVSELRSIAEENDTESARYMQSLDDEYYLNNGMTEEELELSKQPTISSIIDYLYQKEVLTTDELDAIAMDNFGEHISKARAKADTENGPYNYLSIRNREKLTKLLKKQYADVVKDFETDRKARVEAKKKADNLRRNYRSEKDIELDEKAKQLSAQLAKERGPVDAAEWYEQRALASQSLTSTKSLRDRKSPGKYMQSLDEEDFTTQERFNEYQDLRSKYGTQDTGLLKRLSPANIVGRFASSVMDLANNNGRVVLTNEKTGDTQEFQNSAEASAFLNGIKSSETRADYKATDLNSAFAKNNTLEGYKVSFPDGMLVKDLRQAVIDGMLRGNYSHFILTDEKALESARNRIRNHNTVEQAVTDFQQLANHGKGNLSKTDIVFGEQLLIDIADKMRQYEEGTLAPNESSDPEGLYDNFQKVTADLCAAASRAGQNLQAFSMLKKLTPEGRLYYVQSQVNALITDMVDRKGFSRIGGYRYMTDAQGKYYYKLDKNGNYELVRDGNVTPIQISQELTERMLSCTTQAEMEAVEEAIIQEIAAKIPTTITDRVIAWRYLAMLGNPRTHIRNIVSNLAMGKAVDVKNVIKGALEDRVLGDKTEGRTATLHRDSEQRTALLDFADTDWERDANDELTLNGGKQGYQSRLNDARNKLGFKNFDIIDRIAKLNNQLLDKEDWNAAKRAYKKAFANYCEANSLTVEQMEANTVNSNTRLAQARAYAINEAAKATYHDANEVATLLNKLEKSSPVASLIVGGLVPFKKTPANILKRGIEYSPIGIAKGIADWVKASADSTQFEESTWALNNEDALSQTGSRADGNFGNSTKLANTAFERYSADAKRTYMVAQALDELASGLTGTMVMLIGALLAHWGLLKAGGDDDDSLEYYDQMTGNQEYSITLGGKNYTLDWLTPISMPLFTGAVISDMAEGEGLEWNEVLDAIGKLADPVMNLSVLQGIDNAINSYDSGLGQAVLSAAEGYVGQFIPTALGQVARTIDPTRRTTYVAKEGESALGKDLGTFVNKLENKIPGLSFTNAAYVDQWGRQEVDQDPFILRLLKNSVFPWYEKDINKTSADDYISQLYQATGDTGVIPDTASTRFTFNNQNYYLMSDEYQATKELVGQLSNSGVNSLITTAGFSNLTADEQADLVSDVYSFARAVAKSDYAAAKGIKYTESNTTTRLKDAINSGLSVGQAVYINYMTSQMTADKDTNGKSISGTKKAKVLAFYQALGLTNEQIKAISQYDYD